MEKTAGNSGNISNKAGLPPGALVHVGRKKTDRVTISAIDYTKDEFEQIECKSADDCAHYKDKNSVSWINVNGLHEPNVIESIGKVFDRINW
jgi:magnesium transporter